MTSHLDPDVFVTSIVKTFQANKALAERAVAQVSDESLHMSLDDNTNSIAIIMKHVAGNLISRWSAFLTTDGEKPDRNRDSEFIDTFDSRDDLFDHWEKGWKQLFSELCALTADDLTRAVKIRGVTHSVPLAMSLSLGHACYHIGQIMQLARHFAGDNWTTLTIARGKSEQFNQENWGTTGRSHS